MSTYASQKDVENYIEGWVTDDPFALERLIQRAEQDIDKVVLFHGVEQPPTQVISVPGAASGIWRITWNGIHSQTISEPWNVGASQLQADLQALTDIGVGNVSVLGANPFTLVWDATWSRGFTNLDIPLVTVDASGLTPAVIPTVVEVPGLKLNPLSNLDRNQVLCLSRATCAQVEYRNAMGPAFFVRAQYESVRGPDFTTQGKLPYISPKAKRELAQSGLLFHAGRAVASRTRRGTSRGRATF